MERAQVSGGNRLLGVQYLRFVAAFLVVCYHAWQMVPLVGRGDLGEGFELGAAGVDVFFAISGFIIYVISSRKVQAPGQFLVSRVLRVGPPYWVMTLLVAMILLLAPSLFSSARLTTSGLFASLAFIPSPHPTMAGAVPLLTPGWTLNYEILFYCIFAVSMSVSYKSRFTVCSMIIVAACVCGVVAQKRSVVAEFYTSTILLEFVFGMAVGKIYLRGRMVPSSAALSVLVLLSISFYVAVAWVPVSRLSGMRAVWWGLPGAFLLYVTVSAERVFQPGNRLLLLFGDASYSVYLTHLFVLGFIRAMYAKFQLASVMSDAILIGASVTLSFAVGVMAYWWIEKPLVGKAMQLRDYLQKRPIFASVQTP